MVAKNIVSKIGEWGDVWLYSLLIDGLDVRGDSHGAVTLLPFARTKEDRNRYIISLESLWCFQIQIQCNLLSFHHSLGPYEL
ncbi:unnamed protein product [Arabidopsis thaliana]|uniref:(thale cress) hypothetical protein n=1 Tax=Arabidopsis thaliana TaxID=3702 RepID=A0A7G2F3D7_ARATH|nr:unnamed protein product [Arabidopsis thaliana]